MFEAKGTISDRLRKLFGPNDPGWSYKGPKKKAGKPPKPPKNVVGRKLTGRK
jgi:hypothetical protein